jgi:predicted ATPase
VSIAVDTLARVSIAELRAAGYRSIRDLAVPFTPVTVFTGSNGVGASNVVRALITLASAARGELARDIAHGGGMASAIWAGARGKGAGRFTLSIHLPPIHYEIACALRGENDERESMFALEPHVKEERVWTVERNRRVVHLERTETSAMLRNGEGARVIVPAEMNASESLLSQLSDAHRFVEVSSLRGSLRSLRVHRPIRTDLDARVRHPCVAMRTPVLAPNGDDLAAALRSIEESGQARALSSAISAAFPGAALVVHPVDGRLEVHLRMPGVTRTVTARELSDGTLRYLALIAALLAPQPASVLVLEDPETSLHEALHAPLASLVAQIAKRLQVIVITRSTSLAHAIGAAANVSPHVLTRREGSTQLARSGDDEYDDEPTNRG